MKKKTIVFFPIEVGLAHVVRSLGLADELQKRGNNIIFVLPKRKWSLLKNSKITPIDISPCSPNESISVINIIKNRTLLQKLASEDLALLKKYHPDCAIVDFRPSAIAASVHLKIPTFCLTGSLALPYTHYVPHFFNLKILNPFVYDITQLLISYAKKKYLIGTLLQIAQTLGSQMNENEFVDRITYLVPEESFYLPLAHPRENVHYIGHLLWAGFNHFKTDSLHTFFPNGKTVYVSFGGTGFNPSKLISLSSALIRKGYKVIISSSTIAKPEDFSPHKNLFVSPFLSTKEVLERVDAVICHGGYGTMIEAVLAKKPVIAIPFNPDQWIHAVRFKELGIGVNAINSPFLRLYNALTLNWKNFQKITSSISEEEIVAQLENVLQNYQVFHKRLQTFNRKISLQTGAERGADIIEKTLFNL